MLRSLASLPTCVIHVCSPSAGTLRWRLREAQPDTPRVQVSHTPSARRFIVLSMEATAEVQDSELDGGVWPRSGRSMSKARSSAPCIATSFAPAGGVAVALLRASGGVVDWSRPDAPSMEEVVGPNEVDFVAGDDTFAFGSGAGGAAVALARASDGAVDWSRPDAPTVKEVVGPNGFDFVAHDGNLAFGSGVTHLYMVCGGDHWAGQAAVLRVRGHCKRWGDVPTPKNELGWKNEKFRWQ
ncbi:uncharacterized protein LOC123448835 [Hordeum vulgare subsp. vulgare]|uniref:uncharacterized protein LOC123448835 n=1 Tax=Hordeum vulgare subsp. vulgare TaxID=112509 RepID=UPI00162C253E|nr:uncharacterized protein LOC123448835 [Hordeum vulgare subsp. vulgare]